VPVEDMMMLESSAKKSMTPVLDAPDSISTMLFFPRTNFQIPNIRSVERSN
jgi:hypothetical protein